MQTLKHAYLALDVLLGRGRARVGLLALLLPGLLAGAVVRVVNLAVKVVLVSADVSARVRAVHVAGEPLLASVLYVCGCVWLCVCVCVWWR